ncbi:hypothetical protein ABQE93_26765 [Mycolicibacterium sp. XJ662]
MTTTPTAANIQMPAGAVSVDSWYHPDQRIGDPPLNGGEPGSLRHFTGSSWAVEYGNGGSVSVLINGEQHADGRIERNIAIDDDSFSVGQARQLAAALAAAADEVEQMNNHEGIEASR